MTVFDAWRRLRRTIAGEPYCPVDLSDDELLRLLERLSAPQTPRVLEQIQQGRLSLIEACVDLLSDSKQLAMEEFVCRAYRGLLGREPDEEGLSDYIHAVRDRKASRWWVVASLLSSPEFHGLAKKERGSCGPPPQGRTRWRAILADALQRILYPEVMLPPLLMRRCVGEELGDIHGLHFKQTGLMLMERLVEETVLRPDNRVLDLGSGCGRIAIPLTEVINPPGFYFGLEAVRAMVRWCRRKITARFPHFEFMHCDVYNGLYNPKGTAKPGNYHFPFSGGRFDLVVATSIFTHLPPEAAENYARESGRVLKPGGHLFGTFFLVENGTRSADGRLNFNYELSKAALTVNATRPEEAIAYRTDWLLEAFQASGLELSAPTQWGNWAGRKPAIAGQDVLLFRKRE